MTLEADFFVKFQASLDGLAEQAEHQASLLRQIHAALDHIPQDYPVTGSGTTNSSGTVVFACQGPDVGRQWQLRNLVVGGVTKGALYFYALGAEPTAGQLPGLKDATKTRWPAPSFYGTHQFVLQPHEKLWVAVTTATDTAQVFATGTAEDYVVAAYRPSESL